VEAEDTQVSTQALDLCSGTDVEISKCEIKAISKVASAAGDVYSGAKTAITIMQALGLLETPPSQQELFNRLDDHLTRIGVSLADGQAAIRRSLYIPNAIANMEQTRQLALQGMQVAVSSATYHDSREDAIQAQDKFAFKRMYTGQPTGLPSTHISQSNFVPPRDTDEANPPAAKSGDMIYDWRLGVAQLMQIIGYRLAIMSSADPEWGTNHLFSFGYNAEIDEYRNALVKHFNKMRQGIKCSTIGNNVCSSHSPQSEVWCQDIYAMDYRRATVKCGPTNASLVAAKRTELIHELESTMPLFEMQKMIDVLYLYSHPGPDLSESLQQIDMENDTSLCLNVDWDTARTPVGVNTCLWTNGQWWIYDRRGGTVWNPWADRCLQVAGGNWKSGTQLVSNYCSSPAANDASQQWTWDPERKRLRNALNSRLVLTGSLAPQTWVMMTDDSYNSEFNAGQAWHAD
jgi:hypothetical protein